MGPVYSQGSLKVEERDRRGIGLMLCEKGQTYLSQLGRKGKVNTSQGMGVASRSWKRKGSRPTQSVEKNVALLVP